MCHADIILFTGLKHLAHFSLMKSLIRSYLPPINNLATCDPTGIQDTLCAVQHRSVRHRPPRWHCPPRAAAAAGTGLLDRAALTKCFVLVTLPGITRKWVRALPHTSGVWITLGKYLHSVIVEGLMHRPTVLFFFFAVPSRLNWKKSHHTEPLRKGNTFNTDLILAR